MKYLFILFMLSLFTNSYSGEVFKIGVSPVMSSAGIFIAKEKGYFEQVGLKNTELVIFRNSGAPMNVLLSNGELDVGAGNLNSGIWNAIQKGIGIKVVADKGHVGEKTSYISLLVRSDLINSKKYKSIADLKNFRMGFTSEVGVSQQVLLDRILSKGGLNLADVQVVKLAYPEMNIAFKNKSIDATIQIEPFVTAAIKSDVAKMVETAYVHYPNQQSAGILFSPSTIKHRELGIKFLAAYVKGIRDYNDAFLQNKNKKEIIELLKKYITIQDDSTWLESIPVGLSNDGKVNVASLKDDLSWYEKNKFIEKAPKFEDVYDESFIDEALKLLKDK